LGIQSRDVITAGLQAAGESQYRARAVTKDEQHTGLLKAALTINMLFSHRALTDSLSAPERGIV